MIVAGTGHRPNKLGGYSQEVLDSLVAVAKPTLLELKPERVISGMALGWDTALALAAIELAIPLTAAIPFFGQEAMWPENSQRMFNDILKKANDVVYVCDKGYAAWKMQIRNEWMVDHCDLLLALWDGTTGGTNNCIKYANKKNRQIKNIWDNFQEQL